MKKILLVTIFSFLLFFPRIVSGEDDNPSLVIITPEENSQVFGSRVEVSFIVRNFIFTSENSKLKNVPNQGHLLVFLDQENDSSTSGQVVNKAANFFLNDLPSGEHRLTLTLVNSDGSSFSPPVSQTVKFTTSVKKEDLSPTIIEENKGETKEKQLKNIKTVIYLSSAVSLALLTIIFLLLIARRKKV